MDNLTELLNSFFENADSSIFSDLHSSDDLLSFIKENQHYDFSPFSDEDILNEANLFSNRENSSIESILNPETAHQSSISFGCEEIDQLLDMCNDAQESNEGELGDVNGEVAAKGAEVSFTGAGRCWWCSGTGVVWSGSENEVCSHCGGSGIGPE